MKKLNLIFAFLIVILFSNCTDKESKDSTATANKEAAIEKEAILPENLATTDLNVEGMVCEGCQHLIQDEVSKINGVGSCKVSLADKVAHIEYDKTKLNDDDLIKSISSLEDGQYKASKKNVSDDVNETEIESNSSSQETTAQVSLPSFEIPNLFTLLLEQL